MARTLIKGTLSEQEHHSGKQPSLLGELTVGDKKYTVAGWIYYHADGSVAISIQDTSQKKNPAEGKGK